MNKRMITLSALVVLAALTRLVPHPPNVTPIAALALFGDAFFAAVLFGGFAILERFWVSLREAEEPLTV